MDVLRIRLLGGFRVQVGTREIPDEQWRLRKSRAVVKLLGLAPAHRLHRDQVIDALWPELDPAAAANQLRKAVHETRRTIDPDPAATQAYLASGELLALRREVTWVDVEAFEAATTQARRCAEVPAYQTAIDLYGGDLLPEDRYEEWVLAREGGLRADFVALLVELARLFEARGDLDGALATLRRAVARDPPNEEAGAALMRVYALAGRRGDALASYERLGATLRSELGVDPDPATQRLAGQIRAAQVIEPQLSGELWEEVGDLRLAAADSAGAADAYERAVAAAGPQPGDHAARRHRKAAQAHLMRHAAEHVRPHLDAAEAALRARPDEAEAGRLLGVRAGLACELADYAAAADAAEASLDAATRHGGPEDVAAARETLAIACHYRGAWREGLHTEIERLAAATGDDPALSRICEIHCCIGQYHLYGDGLRDSVEDYARGTLDRAIARDVPSAQAFAWCLLGESLLLSGRWDEAAGCLERSTEVYAGLGATSGVLPWQRLAELAAGRGDGDAAAGYLRRGMALATVNPLARHAWARLYATAAFDAVERGEPAEAIRAVRSAAAAAARYGECPSCAALLNPVAAEAFAALGDPAGAAGYAAAADQVAGEFASAAWSAMAETAHASVALAAGESTTARQRFIAGAQRYDQAGQPFWSARSRLQAARFGNGGRADRELVDAAAAVFDRLGAMRLLAVARREGARER